MNSTVREPARDLPVAGVFDLCVIGGSCTGVFAAVRAARLGLSVALVEQNILLGGMAASAQVNEWHSLHDAAGQNQIIGGLTAEVLESLRGRGMVKDCIREHRGPYFIFNSAELALELDGLIRTHGIRLFLKAGCVGAIRDGYRIEAAIIEDKSGRRAIRARHFIDASGDGDLLRRAGFFAWQNEHLQPVSYQMLAAGMHRLAETSGRHLWHQVKHLARDFDYPSENATPWLNDYPAPADITNVYGPRLNDCDASDADQFTQAVMEGRRCHRALLDMMRQEVGPDVAAISFAHALGVRETWHARCLHRLGVGELLSGVPFADAIASGTYPVDVHSSAGTLLRYMDGREESIGKDGVVTWRRWRDEASGDPGYYQIPYRCLVPETAENLLVAGRLLDADREAFGGVRVMVNMNQTGEAAGVAAALAVRHGVSVAGVDIALLQKTLREGGSLLPKPKLAQV
jgi:2-polyprenyl-6-methoxyphenol hydroxylase-like FAD-dependent oxidoreductase